MKNLSTVFVCLLLVSSIDAFAVDDRGNTAAMAIAATALIGPATAAVKTSVAAASLPLPTYDAAAVANLAQPVPAGSAPAGAPVGGTAGSATISDTGAARYEVPLEVVPGRGGYQPKLSLSYSSDGGNGQLGVGFALSGLSQIRRCDKTVATDGTANGADLSSSDVFCLNGLRLIAVSGVYGANGTEYRTLPDTHVRVKSFDVPGGKGPGSFTVWTADGQVQDYGKGETVRVPATDNVGTTATYNVAWPIVESKDRSGNVLAYKYLKGVLNGVEVERSLTSIQYGNGTTLDRQVEFTYTPRQDHGVAYQYGVRRFSSVLLTGIQMSVQVGGGWQRARHYGLSYENSPQTGASALKRIKECGRFVTECKRPTEFVWKYGNAGFGTGLIQSGTQPLTPSSADSALISADYNGDGRTDLAWPEQDTWKYLLAENNSSPVYRQVRNGVPTSLLGTKDTAFPFDYDLDGRTDLMPRSSSISNYSPILSRPGNVFVKATTEFSGGFNQVTVGSQIAGGMTGDFDGDGYQDVLQYRKPLGASNEDLPFEWTWRWRTGTVSDSIDNATAPSDKAAFSQTIKIQGMQGTPPSQVRGGRQRRRPR